MAIDFDVILDNINEIKYKVDDLREIVMEAQGGKFTSALLGDTPFTTAQKADLVSQYNALKSEIATLYGQLP